LIVSSVGVNTEFGKRLRRLFQHLQSSGRGIVYRCYRTGIAAGRGLGGSLGVGVAGDGADLLADLGVAERVAGVVGAGDIAPADAIR
jgi:hypothetical protein